MTDQEPVAWLREQIEARLALAQGAAERTDGRWWRRMTDAGHFDDHTLEPAGALYAGEPVLDADGDVCGGEDIVVYDEGRPSDVQFDHIAANDPQDTIARCEAELAILNEHGPTDWTAYGGPVCRRCVIPYDLASGSSPQSPWVPWPCRTVRLLGSGYRARPGYREEDWKPGVRPWKAPSGHQG